MGKRKLNSTVDVGQTDEVKEVNPGPSGKDMEIDLESDQPQPDVSDGDEDDDNVDDEDEEEEEDETNEEPDKPKYSGPPTKKQRKQLSAQEIQVARETAELFKSNIFKLQIDELIKEVKLKDSHIDKIEKVLHKLHDLIKMVKPVENLTLAELDEKFNSKKVVIPFPDPKPTKVNYNFSYLPPEDVSLVGSFGLKTGILQQNGMSIDMVLTMPKQLFQPKDFLNYRIFYKRAFYLAYLAENLISLTKKNNLPVKITYKYLNDDILCPILRLESIKTDNPQDLCFHKTKFTINLIVGFPFGVFDVKKLLPNKNCIRIQSDEIELPPTPLYNASILSSISYDYYLKYLYTSKKSAESFKDACILGKIWLNQRGFGSSFSKGGFGHFEFAMLMSTLLHGGGLNGNKILLHGFSSYQLFKGTIKYLATMDLSSGYLSFSSAIGENIPSKFNPNEGFNVPTIFDKNVKLNILWKMTNYSYSYLKRHASETLVLLNDVVKDRFDPILLNNADFDQLKFDMILNISIPEELIEQFGPLEKITFLNFENFIMNKLYIILKKALGDRVSEIFLKLDKHQSFFQINKRKINSQSNNYIVGLILNPEECEKLVTKGPNNDDEEAGLKFKKFWGTKASLRRFKDGSIQNCVVWQSKNSEPIIVSIIKYVLDNHLSPDISAHVLTQNIVFNNLLPIPLLPSGSNQSIISTSSFTSLRNSFDALSKVLHNLTLPLNIKSISPASSSLRYTSLLHPVPFAISNPDFWNELVLQFESSSRWPDELTSLEKTKTAFLLKVLDLLNKDSIYKAFITQDNSISFNTNITLLNILTPEGYGFKIRVLTERDEVLYLRAVSNASEKQKGRLQDIYLKFNQKYIGVVKHSRTITTLAHHYQFYSPTVRLFKKWLDSHLLLNQFNEELIELIALKPFVDPAPYSIPHSVENGFLKILNFLSNWNWKDQSLILDLVKLNDSLIEIGNENKLLEEFDIKNLSDKLSIASYQIIESNFEKIRKLDPSGIKTQLFIGSKDDPSGILWSNELTLPISSRLTSLSRASMELIKTTGIDENNINLLFTPVLKDYDFIIDLKTNKLSISAGVLPSSNTFKNLINGPQSFPDDIITKYDLTHAFLEDLNRKFGHVIIFSTRKFGFLQDDGSNIITGLFIPSNLSKKKFKVNFGIHIKPIDKEDVIINKDSILNQIKLLGGDLIKDMKLKD